MEHMDHQYRIIAQGAGWTDRSTRGRLRFEGRDAATFLQALVSNDVLPLVPGAGLHATYLTPQGRMIADLDILHRGSSLMVFVPDGRGSELASRFDALIFAEALVVTDVSADWAELSVIGTSAASLIGNLLDCDAAQLSALSELAQLDAANGFVIRTGEASLPAYHVVVPARDRDGLVARFEAAGVVAMADELATALRIEVGRPRWGVDLTAETIPLEAGLLERSISTTKGCYVGQEVVIRILHRGGGRVAKRLVILAFAAGATGVPTSGAVVSADDRDVGHVTSAALSPGRGRVVALAYVHRDVAEVGRALTVSGSMAEIVGFAR